jgi:signal transduction histidine kinase
VQPEVPDALIGDAGRLRQVLLNLVGNAINFTDAGEVEVSVEVADPEVSGPTSNGSEEAAPVPISDRDPPTSDRFGLRFTVRDTGIGIPKDQQERIFRAFEQEDTSTTQVRRYRSGLTTPLGWWRLMGGQITWTARRAGGSTFRFTAEFGVQPHPPRRL